MNRTEALQAAFMIAGPNVTADEHIQYAEFLLGEHVVRVGDYIMGEDTQSVCGDSETGWMSTWQIIDTRVYIPHEFIGDRVYADNGDLYPEGAVALDGDRDVWYFENGVWTCYDYIDGEKTEYYGQYCGLRESYGAVFVA